MVGVGGEARGTVVADAREDALLLRLVVVSLEAWDQVWRRNQYLLDGLLSADDTIEILFVEPPADPLHALTRRSRPQSGLGLRAAEGYGGRLWLYQPTKLLPRVAGPMADALIRSGIRRCLRRLGWDVGVLWINDPAASRLAGVLRWPTLYDITDDWVRAHRTPREHERLRAADAELLASCDEVVVCSAGLKATKGSVRTVHLIPNAVDSDRYRLPTTRPLDLPGAPVALYVGTLHEDRLDVELVVRTATMVGDTGGVVVLVGPDALSAENSALLRTHPSIVVLGPRGRDAVPAYLQHAHALIVPHVVDGFTESLDPIKLYEYLAVGRPIVSTPVAGFREHPGSTVAERDEFPAAVAAALAGWTPFVEHGDVPDWSDRVGAIREVVTSLAAKRTLPAR